MKKSEDTKNMVPVRIPRNIWRELKIIAAQQDRTLSDVVRQRLKPRRGVSQIVEKENHE